MRRDITPAEFCCFMLFYKIGLEITLAVMWVKQCHTRCNPWGASNVWTNLYITPRYTSIRTEIELGCHPGDLQSLCFFFTQSVEIGITTNTVML